MTRKHFELIAKTIRPKVLKGSYDCFVLAHDLADEFMNNYPAFKRTKFLKACGCYGEDK